MVVYADVLIVLNLIVDYFLLLAVQKLSNKKCSVWRTVLGALVGAVSSLYIFLPQNNLFIELLVRITVCLLMTLITFGFINFKQYIKKSLLLFGVTCGYAGIMIALWYLFKPNGMVINNSVVYFNISPIILVVSTVVGYVVFTILTTLFSKGSKCAEKCKVTVFVDSKSVDMIGILDTGNSIEDVFGNSEVIISDRKNLENLFGKELNSEDEKLKLRYRVIPCNTVSGNSMLEGYRCDSAIIKEGKKSVALKKPVLAISNTKFNDDYSAIVNPRIFI